MNIEGAVIKEQGVTFAIVCMKMQVVKSPSQSRDARESLSSYFSGMPIVLMAQDSRGTPRYHGRKDIIKFLTNIHISRIPWKRYSIC